MRVSECAWTDEPECLFHRAPVRAPSPPAKVVALLDLTEASPESGLALVGDRLLVVLVSF